MVKALKIILKILLILVLIFALLIGAAWGFVYFKYKVNMFSVIGTVNTLNENVNVSTLAPKQIGEEDFESLQHTANLSFVGLIEKDSDGVYKVNHKTTIPVKLQDLKLTDKQVCALTKILLDSNDVSLNIGGSSTNLKDYDFELLQIAFSDLDAEAKTMKFNVVCSVSLEKLKNQLTSFPLSILKSKIPQKLYISSTVVVSKNSGNFVYNVENSSLTLNNAKEEKVEELCTLANNFINIGTASELNKTIGENFVNAIIGNETNQGFAYILASKTTAVDFDLEKDGEIKLVIK